MYKTHVRKLQSTKEQHRLNIPMGLTELWNWKTHDKIYLTPNYEEETILVHNQRREWDKEREEKERKLKEDLIEEEP